MTESTDDYNGEESPFLTVQEIASHLKASKMSVYRNIHRGVLPATKIGRLYRVRKSDLDTFVAQARYTP